MKIKSFAVIVATCTILSHWDAFGCSEGVFMKEIKLTQGKVALVDDQDYEWLSNWKWHASKAGCSLYAQKQIYVGVKKQKILKMHRLILGLTSNDHVVDHIDGNGLNNQRSNLRVCTRSENNKNRSPNRGAFSKHRGVCYNKASSKWIARIRGEGRVVFLGYFHSEDEAAKAYNIAAIKYHGEFARLNATNAT